MPPASPDPVRVPRRRVLAVAGLGALAGAVALAGCTGGDAGPGPTGSAPGGSPSGSADADVVLRATVAAQESQLAARYAAAVARYPELATTLAVGDRHVSYAAAVGDGSASAPSPSAPAVPPRAAVVGRLRAAEAGAARERLAQCGRAGDPELARVLALIGAGCAAAAAELARAS